MKFDVCGTGGGFLGGSDGKESACNEGDLGSVPGLGRCPGGGNGNTFQYSHLEEPMNRGAWQAYSPWGQKESDMTEKQTLSILMCGKCEITGQTRYYDLE